MKKPIGTTSSISNCSADDWKRQRNGRKDRPTAPSMPLSALAHVTVDYCWKLHEMARLFVTLANDDPAAEPPEPARLIDIGNRIAEGIFNVDDWRQLGQMSIPSGLNCPPWRSALYEIKRRAC